MNDQAEAQAIQNMQSDFLYRFVRLSSFCEEIRFQIYIAWASRNATGGLEF